MAGIPIDGGDAPRPAASEENVELVDLTTRARLHIATDDFELIAGVPTWVSCDPIRADPGVETLVIDLVEAVLDGLLDHAHELEFVRVRVTQTDATLELSCHAEELLPSTRLLIRPDAPAIDALRWRARVLGLALDVRCLDDRVVVDLSAAAGRRLDRTRWLDLRWGASAVEQGEVGESGDPFDRRPDHRR